MEQVIHTYVAQILDSAGQRYQVEALADERPGSTWEGRLRFTPLDGDGPVLETGRETTQSNLGDLEYWASGLEPVFLEGALERAWRHVDDGDGSGSGSGEERAEASAPGSGEAAAAPVQRRAEASTRPVLDPSAVFEQGEHVLRSELGALDTLHLQAILTDYALDEPGRRAEGVSARGDLIERIVEGVRRTRAGEG
jgi:hypothetical protein